MKTGETSEASNSAYFGLLAFLSVLLFLFWHDCFCCGVGYCLISSGLPSEVWVKSDKLREECKKTLQAMESLFDTIFILNVDLQAASKDKNPGIRIIKPESENRKPTVVVIDIFEKNFRDFAQYKPSDYFFDIFWKFIHPSQVRVLVFLLLLLFLL
jgi:hypothetical protein